MELAPAIYPLARRKELTVSEALAGNKWMMGLRQMNTESQIDQFIFLWEKLQGLSLRQSRDVIRWVREGSGHYSAKSAYDAQFLCRLPSPALSKVWSLKP